MAHVYIGLSSPRKFMIGAEAIKFWQTITSGRKVGYSHSYLKFESAKIPNSVYHAAHGMVHFRSEANFLKDNLTVLEFKVEVSEEQRLQLLRDCMSLAGDGYGYKELLKILAADVAFHVFAKQMDFHDSYGYICSELTGRLLQFLGYRFDKPLYLLKPCDIEQVFVENGHGPVEN